MSCPLVALDIQGSPIFLPNESTTLPIPASVGPPVNPSGTTCAQGIHRTPFWCYAFSVGQGPLARAQAKKMGSPEECRSVREPAPGRPKRIWVGECSSNSCDFAPTSSSSSLWPWRSSRSRAPRRACRWWLVYYLLHRHNHKHPMKNKSGRNRNQTPTSC